MWNKNATGNHDRWRLLVNGAEYFIAGATFIKTNIQTCSEVNEDGELIYFIECECNKVEVENNLAVIK